MPACESVSQSRRGRPACVSMTATTRLRASPTACCVCVRRGAMDTRTEPAGAAANEWYRRIPLELHGHRKKLDFFLRSIERLQQDRRLRASEVTVLEIG